MNILLTNDDGYSSEGLLALERKLMEYGHHVAVVAPSTQQSGKSHSMTVDQPLRLTEYGPEHFHLSGTPVDCIIYAEKSGLLSSYDLVISGINLGYNISSDIVFSGTCGAARQAAMYGHKAIAISENLKGSLPFHFEEDVAFLQEHLEKWMNVIGNGTFLNLNFPHVFNGSWEKASVGYVDYKDTLEVYSKEGNTSLISVVGRDRDCTSRENRFRPDYQILEDQKASVSLLRVEQMLDEKAMECL